MTANDHRLWDCLVIGGGPAGLTAALYLARFRRTVLVIDGGRSRAAGIPRSHNHPGFIDGISGETLLQTLRKQALQYGAEIKSGNVVNLEVIDDGFKAQTEAREFSAACVVLAAGIADACPDIMNPSSTLETGHIRYCPVCDGFEAADKKIAVYGNPKDAAAKARFLRVYSSEVSLIPVRPGEPCGPSDDFELLTSPARSFTVDGSGISVALEDGEVRTFDVLYPALGCRVHSDLATRLGAKSNSTGCLVVDDRQQTTVESLYAAGDVVSDLHQIVVAEGHAAIAATAIHNRLPFRFREHK
jgi:thioredoxin reductase (NADPH)